MILSHRIELRPTVNQRVAFVKACGVARYAYNWGLAEWKKQYAAGEKPNALALKKQWNQEKPEWVYDSPKDANQTPFLHLRAAFQKVFKKTAGFPKFKRKGIHDSFSLNNDKFHINDRYARLPKIGSVKMRERLRFTGKIMSGTVSRDADRWFLSVAVDVGENYRRERTGNAVVGVDLGITTAATLSTGEKIEGPKPLKKLLTILRRRSRQHSRKKKGSQNRRKSAMSLARLHRRIKCQRHDFLHKLTTRLCRENQTVVIEDLNVKGMMANHKLARAISDIGLSEFRRQVEYKSKLYDDELVEADRWFPSTKTCNRCGLVNDIPLSQRVYKCECGHVEDRDVNAAKNLRDYPRLRGINACGHGSAGPRLSTDETAVVEAGTKPCSLVGTY
jgi:putative transposase